MAATGSSELRAAVFLRDRSRCVICASTDRVGLDHIRPQADGGDERIENLQTLCHSCNASKKNRDCHEWLSSGAWRARFTTTGATRKRERFVGTPTTFRELIDSWPTIAAFAFDLGVDYETCRQWRRRQSIPPRWWRGIVEAAQEAGVPGVSIDALMQMAARRDGEAA